MSSLLERYLAGAHDEVYRAALRAPANEAAPVAAEMIRRVRINLVELAQRWQQRGLPLLNPLGQPRTAAEALMWVEDAVPPTLRELYQQIGWSTWSARPRRRAGCR